MGVEGNDHAPKIGQPHLKAKPFCILRDTNRTERPDYPEVGSMVDLAAPEIHVLQVLPIVNGLQNEGNLHQSRNVDLLRQETTL
jgi:hypothetical protein